MTQQGANSTALIFSIIALIVAVLAAGFTGWQAVTAHLVRNRPTKARWMFEYPPTGSLSGPKPWMLHNTGGSIASDVSVRIVYPARPGYEEATHTDFTIDAPIDHGQARAVPGTEARGDPRLQLHQVGSSYQVVAANAVAGAWYPIDRFARVSWRDYRGKEKKARVRLR